MRVSSNEYNPTFNAQLISQWKCHNAKGNLRNVSVVALEKRDLEYINNFRKNLDKFNHLAPLRQAIIDASTSTISAVLEIPKDILEKVKMFMAIYEGKPCGFLVANVLKKQPGTGVEVYTSRHNPAKNETEIDWLVTWNPNRNEVLKGVGKALVGEYFRTVKADKFRDVFVRSEIPEHSYAYYFYESVGFERIGNKRTKLCNKNHAQYVVADDSNPNDTVIPMIVTRSVLQQKAEELAKNMGRREFVKNSIDIEELIEQ
jgi:hypothetical protein